MPMLSGPTWVRALLQSNAVVDERDATMENRRLDKILAMEMPKPSPAVQRELDDRQQIEDALAMEMPKPSPTQPPVAPEAVPVIEQVDPLPEQSMPPVSFSPQLPDAPQMQPMPAPAIPKPEIGPDGLLHLPGQAV